VWVIGGGWGMFGWVRNGGGGDESARGVVWSWWGRLCVCYKCGLRIGTLGCFCNFWAYGCYNPECKIHVCLWCCNYLLSLTISDFIWIAFIKQFNFYTILMYEKLTKLITASINHFFGSGLNDLGGC